ncbi:MAG: 3'-5' exonuclease, partial [Gammaproteobacteria bacterium]
TGDGDAPLTVVWLPARADATNGVSTKRQAEEDMAEACAAEISHLLSLAGKGRAHYRDEEGDEVPVRRHDIAVLVRKHRHGKSVQQALREKGIASVILSNDSVLETAEAVDLRTLLEAVAAPTDGSLLRRALATPLLGATAADIAELDENEERWSERVTAFRGYNRLWQDEGFSVMFARLLRGERIIGRTLARPDGERAMTNLRHLAELAETYTSHHPGIESLVAWLGRERHESRRGDESRELRLESDDELVRIVTVHKAKGLEYPVVFLPFLWDAKKPEEAGRNRAVLTHDERSYEPVLDLGSPAIEERQAAFLKEEAAEEVRLVYVALTRAARACYLLATPANQCEGSALAGLLGVEDPRDLRQGLQSWCEQAGEAGRCFRPPRKAERAFAAADERPHGEAREFTHTDRLKQRFHIASYSRLVVGAGGVSAEEPDWDETVQATPIIEAATGIHKFPAGPVSGTFLHAMLEALDFAVPDEHENIVRRMCEAYGFTDQTGVLAAWLPGLLATPLEPAGCTLADIARPRRRDEMEFYFSIAGLEAGPLDEMVSNFAPRGARPALHFADIAGQMKGYLDLVFEHAGRYWVVDYKSNRLGSDLSAYTQAALDHAMAEHRYDLQYLIYTVALHRYLATRVPGYDYERHFGGVMYLFLRGMAPGAPSPRGVWYTRPGYDDVRRLDALLEGDKQ